MQFSLHMMVSPIKVNGLLYVVLGIRLRYCLCGRAIIVVLLLRLIELRGDADMKSLLLQFFILPWNSCFMPIG